MVVAGEQVTGETCMHMPCHCYFTIPFIPTNSETPLPARLTHSFEAKFILIWFEFQVSGTFPFGSQFPRLRFGFVAFVNAVQSGFFGWKVIKCLWVTSDGVRAIEDCGKMNGDWSSPRMNCGVWTTLELMINKENNEKIWEKSDNWLKPAPKKREKLKIRFVMNGILPIGVHQTESQPTASWTNWNANSERDKN